MKIVILSDTHSRHDKIEVPEGDLLLIAGDVTSHGHLDEVRALLGLAVGGQASCAEVRERALAHLKDVRARIADLKRMERVLADSVRACDAGRDPGCPLLDTLGAEVRVA